VRPDLTLLDGVRWHGEPIKGDRPAALLAALALHPTGLTDHALADLLWPDEPPAKPTAALQVLVSRVRSTCDAGLVARYDGGYRLGIARDRVDALLFDDLLTRARRDLGEGRPAEAVAAAERALTLVPHQTGDGESDSPLATLRELAGRQRAEAERLLGLALAETGAHERAFPVLERASVVHPHDEGVVEQLLRSEAAVRGAAAALERYESYRARLADSLGTDPCPALQRVYAELLAADHPVRDGVRFDGTTLLGRDRDLAELRTLVRASRVVSIVGAGGLGKTRLAHVIGRDAEQPIVHFVELVGVVAPEDVVGEVGSALGVRDSVSGRRTLSPAQRSDVRARIAQHLDQSPTLLILDNCEHVVTAAAELVAFLVVTTRDLRIVTTTRAPLNIAAERVYLLDQLATADAQELFRRRAVAARPDVVLDPDAVAGVVDRLDGLPLAIELAAAKVRVMSVADIGRRLENRFTLLRGGDRSAPDRHQTLLAVIDWSWNLLRDQERRALRWLSVFHDGFTLDGAEALLGGEALDAVQWLVDQSLLSVRDARGSVRYRMLETVREFGRMQLVDAGEDDAARQAQRAWARDYARTSTPRLFSPDQIATMDALREEETNLADVLRQALGEPDPDAVVELLAALGGFWSISGEHPRVIALVDAVQDALRGWTPDDDVADAARIALALLVSNAAIAYGLDAREARDLLEKLGPSSDNPHVAAVTAVLLVFDPSDWPGSESRLKVLCDDPDPRVAGLSLQWFGHAQENAGNPEAAIESASRALALVSPEDGPWNAAMLHTQLAAMHAQLGHLDQAAFHASRALPVLDRLQANDDAIQVRAMLAVRLLTLGRLDEASEEIDRIAAAEQRRSGFGGGVVVATSKAELALASGDLAEGLRLYRAAMEQLRALRFPGLGEATGLEPWILFGEAAAVSAHALHGRGDDGADIYGVLRSKALAVLDSQRVNLDFPVAGLVFFGLAMWGLHRDAVPAPMACRLLALANRFAYNRLVPTMAWDNAAAPAERLAPGLLDQLLEEYGDRRGPDLLDEARAAVRELLG